VLVEFALISPIIMLLLFGVIEFGTVFGNTISFRQGVREGARQGVVANFGSTSTCNLHGTTGASSNIQNLMGRVRHDLRGGTGADRVRPAPDLVLHGPLLSLSEREVLQDQGRDEHRAGVGID
jgi:hypothetical protein